MAIFHFFSFLHKINDSIRYGLPLSTKNVNEFIQDLNRKNLKIYEIYSSYGLSGWIIGTGFELIERSKKQA